MWLGDQKQLCLELLGGRLAFFGVSLRATPFRGFGPPLVRRCWLGFCQVVVSLKEFSPCPGLAGHEAVRAGRRLALR